MNPDDHKVVIKESGWRSLGFLLESGEISVAEFLDIAREQATP